MNSFNFKQYRMNPDREVLVSRHKVRSYECDAYRHVNNAVYLNYLEFARQEALEQKGFDLVRLQDNGMQVVIHQIQIQFLKPLRTGDTIEIRTQLASHRRVSGIFYQEIVRQSDDRVCARAAVTWVFTNAEGRPIPIPQEVIRAFAR
ncbi:MAG: acyl-CoA thioesterase [Calditrichaeota bacterium]|nr:MAG: acyl-CoA thioesterase [Calditrichota bacterium]